MDWKEFTTETISTLAWPLIIFYVVWKLKDELGELIPRLRKIKHSGLELEFEEMVNNLALETTDRKDIALVEPKNSMSNFDFLVRLSEIAPGLAILHSFRQVEDAAAIAVAKAYPNLESPDIRSSIRMLGLLQDKVLNEAQFKKLKELRRIRHRAEYMDDFNLHSMPIEVYIEVAAEIENILLNYEPQAAKNLPQ